MSCWMPNTVLTQPVARNADGSVREKPPGEVPCWAGGELIQVIVFCRPCARVLTGGNNAT